MRRTRQRSREIHTLPLWLPDVPEDRGFVTVDFGKATAAGLPHRPVAEAIAAALTTELRPGLERQRRAGLDPGREAQLLDDWHSSGRTRPTVNRKRILSRIATRSDPRDRTSPDPHLELVGWNSEPDPYGPLGPGNRLGLHQLFDTVLPQHPGLHPLRDRRGADRQLPHLLWQQAPWLALGEAGTFGHAPEYRTGVLVPGSAG